MTRRSRPTARQFYVRVCFHDDGAPAAEGLRGNKIGVMQAQLSLPEVVNVNVTHAMVAAVRAKAMALSEVTGQILDLVRTLMFRNIFYTPLYLLREYFCRGRAPGLAPRIF